MGVTRVPVPRVRPGGAAPAEVAGAAERLAAAIAVRLDRRGWRGADPYDGLAAPLARRLRSARPRQALAQAVRRSPVDLRPLLGVDQRRMATTTGLAATAAARLAPAAPWAALAADLGRLTAERQRPDGLWGYEFDVQTRWAFYPAGSANIVATAFAADGCLDTDALPAGRLEALGRGLLDVLWRGTHFGYTQGSGVLIHNANLLGAALAARLAGHGQVPQGLGAELRRAAVAAAGSTLARQRPDGSWPYGEAARLGWVDGFHTAYVLLRLDQVGRAAGVDAAAALDRGTRFYLERLLPAGRPRYRPPPRRGPSDVNTAATALRAAVWAAAAGRADPQLPGEVLAYLRARFLDLDGSVRASASRWRPAARLEFPRWGGAPALDALTAFACWTRGEGRGAPG